MAYYNVDAGSFHTKKLCSRFYSIQVDFYSKKWKESLFERHFRGFRGDVRTPTIARWKARGRLSVHRNSTFFAISCGWDVVSRNLSTSAFFEGGGSVSANIWQGRGHRTRTTVGDRKLEWLPFRVVKMSAVHHLVLSQYTHLTDRWTDRQNCESNNLHCSTCGRMKVIASIIFIRICWYS